MLRAWKGSDRYEPCAQFSTWLHTIATNVCLTAIARRRVQPVVVFDDLGHPQPYPDRLLDDLVARETLELAFITAIQLLPPKQRVVLILPDVLGWSAKEVAEALGDSVSAVTSGLQRARDTRFSKDKSPYKTNVGIHFRHERAKNAHAPGYYLHIGPGEVFAGGGI